MISGCRATHNAVSEICQVKIWGLLQLLMTMEVTVL